MMLLKAFKFLRFQFLQIFVSYCCNAPEDDVCAFGKAQHEYTNLFESQGLPRLSLV